MKNTKNKKSLSLNTQTLRSLQKDELVSVGGGWIKSWDLPCVGTGASGCRICYQ